MIYQISGRQRPLALPHELPTPNDHAEEGQALSPPLQVLPSEAFLPEPGKEGDGQPYQAASWCSHLQLSSHGPHPHTASAARQPSLPRGSRQTTTPAAALTLNSIPPSVISVRIRPNSSYPLPLAWLFAGGMAEGEDGIGFSLLAVDVTLKAPSGYI